MQLGRLYKLSQPIFNTPTQAVKLHCSTPVSHSVPFMPIEVRQKWYLADGKGLVKMSATILSVGTYLKMMSFRITRSRAK
jgi:hypothetical protein